MAYQGRPDARKVALISFERVLWWSLERRENHVEILLVTCDVRLGSLLGQFVRGSSRAGQGFQATGWGPSSIRAGGGYNTTPADA